MISFVKNGTWTSQLLPNQFTLENYFNLVRDPKVAEPILNSVQMAAIATVGNVLLALMVSYWNVLKGWWWKRVSEIVVMLPWAIPGTVIAIALIVAYNRPHWFTLGQVLVGTFWILPLAYFIRHLPVVYRATHSAFSRFEKSQEEAARSLGAGPFLLWRKVIFPAIRPAVLAGALLVLVMSLGEFVSSILLYTFSNRPISVAILAEVRLFNLGSAAAYGVFLTVLIFLITWLSAKWGELQ
ncbi:MAG: ABC transporter permease subunit [Calditrichaeota bacterium]|nr:MAG: ABC transporter permease subunit [Calditrichota bacterium]